MDFNNFPTMVLSQFLYPTACNKAKFWIPSLSELIPIMTALYNNDHNIFSSVARDLFNADPQKAILSLRVYPINLARVYMESGEGDTFKIMNNTIPHDTPVKVNSLDNSMTGFRALNFGHLQVPYFEEIDSFLSYDPYTKLFLYLPFVPLIPLDTKRYRGKTISVDGYIDFYEGNIIYNIYVIEPDDVLGEHPTLVDNAVGKIAVEIPLYSSNTNQVLKDLAVNVLTNSVSGAISTLAGNPLNAIGNATNVLSNSLGIEIGNNTLQKALTNALPYYYKPLEAHLISYTPNIKYHLDDTDYNHLYGVPTKKIGKIKDFGGFTKIGELHSKAIAGVTQKEIDEIETLLKQGIRAGLSQATLSITYNSSHITWASSTSSIKYGLYYSNSFTIDTGYQVDSVQVLMGGADITSTAVSGNQIVISAVTGNIVINVVTSKIPVYYTITHTNLVGATLSNTAVQVEEGTSYLTYINPQYSSGYYLGDFTPTITMDNVPLLNAYVDGQIYIPDVQGNIVISGTLQQSSKLNSDTWTPKSTIVSVFDGEEPVTNLTGEVYVGATQCEFTSLVLDNSPDELLNNSFLYGTANISGVGSNLYTGVNAVLMVSYETGQTYTELGYMTSLHLSNNVDWTNYGDLLEWLDNNFNKVV